MFASLYLVTLFTALSAFAGHLPNHRRHSGKARLHKDSLAPAAPHAKRFGGKATYYIAGLGACGNYNTGADSIVALNAAQWDGGAHCGKTITITEGGKSTQATIVDLCPGCPFGGLDLSESLFSFFHDHGVGVFQLNWEFGGGGGGQAPAQPPPVEEKPAPTPTPTPEPKPEPTPEPQTTQQTTQQAQSPSAAAPSSPSSETRVSSASSAALSSSSALASVLANSTTASATLSANASLPSVSLAANATALLPNGNGTVNVASADRPSVNAADTAIVADSPSADGALPALGELVATLGRLVVLGATA